MTNDIGGKRLPLVNQSADVMYVSRREALTIACVRGTTGFVLVMIISDNQQALNFYTIIEPRPSVFRCFRNAMITRLPKVKNLRLKYLNIKLAFSRNTGKAREK